MWQLICILHKKLHKSHSWNKMQTRTPTCLTHPFSAKVLSWALYNQHLLAFFSLPRVHREGLLGKLRTLEKVASIIQSSHLKLGPLWRVRGRSAHAPAKFVGHETSKAKAVSPTQVPERQGQDVDLSASHLSLTPELVFHDLADVVSIIARIFSPWW